ncbi:uncharacterized protein BJ171DRAFT_507875 [Polychytrium aggregatum]|uniref:uncharacterized protein n=1 Tax=Polychytrium aggregatum TaxID=110093 RepID=UPI0022FE1537|nr:uncharacterized protein BJ171DRAFT_507875 [Polychytrium aggregatum]KAI9203767.1 hypothetical protein BJ171DRAFT_507875 [Polychytrium aggregatum]
MGKSKISKKTKAPAKPKVVAPELSEEDEESFETVPDPEPEPEEMDSDAVVYSSDDDESDGEAPEAVSIKSTKEQALREQQLASELEKQRKVEEKRLRKERSDKLKQQAATKKERLLEKARMLPIEILEEAEIERPATTHPSGTHTRLATQDQRRQKKQLQDERIVRGFKVVALNAQKKKARPLAEEALSFRHQHLYGGRVKRTTSVADLSKRRQKHAAAVFFAAKKASS